MEQSQNTLLGSRPGSRGRSPKSFAVDRVCIEKSCETRLSKYNRYDRCYPHQRIRFPRVRGRTVPD